jgi:starvation-inducible outer membrane lipoprotein
MKKKIVAVALATTMLAGLSGCATWSRNIKSISSDLTGGLDRTVTAYDYSGNVIGQWSGKIDIENNESKVYFDLDGKRVIIYNAIVVTEEN